MIFPKVQHKTESQEVPDHNSSKVKPPEGPLNIYAT